MDAGVKTRGLAKTIWHILKQAALNWVRHKTPRLSAAVAFFSMLSLAPLLVIATAVAGFFYEDATAQDQLVAQMRGLTGQEGATVVRQALENAQFSARSSLWAGAASIAVLLFSASAVFTQLQAALNTIWQIDPSGKKGHNPFLRILVMRGLSLAMVLVLGFLLVVSLVFSVLLAGMQAYLQSIWGGLNVIVGLTELLISLGLFGSLFAVMFRHLPDTKVDPRSSWIGGFLTVILLLGGKWGIGLYLGKSAVGSAYGAAGSLVVFLLWVYYSMLVFFFGAEVTHELSQRRQQVGAAP